MDKREGITFFCRIFLVPQCRKSSKGTLLCFDKSLVMKIFMQRRGGGVASRFYRIVFVSQNQNLPRGTHVFQNCSALENNFG